MLPAVALNQHTFLKAEMSDDSGNLKWIFQQSQKHCSHCIPNFGPNYKIWANFV